MSRAIEQWGIDGRERAQKFDKYRRNEFWHLDRPTQQTVVNVLTKAEQILHDRSVSEAQKYIQQTIFKHHKNHRFITDKKGVNWNEVHEQIINGGCFSNSDMDGLQLVPRRVAAELSVFRALMELNEPPLEDYF